MRNYKNDEHGMNQVTMWNASGDNYYVAILQYEDGAQSVWAESRNGTWYETTASYNVDEVWDKYSLFRLRLL